MRLGLMFLRQGLFLFFIQFRYFCITRRGVFCCYIFTIFFLLVIFIISKNPICFCFQLQMLYIYTSPSFSSLFIIIFMFHKTNNQLAEQDNHKIIALIKSKIFPLHPKVNYFPKVKLQTLPLHHPPFEGKFQQIQIVNENETKFMKFDERQTQTEVLLKAKRYIREKKKTEHIESYATKRDLSDYIKLFEKEEQTQGSKSKKQFLKLKNQSRSSILKEPEPIIETQSKTQRFTYMTRVQQMEMNAKIRKRLNHRKIIGLSKNI